MDVVCVYTLDGLSFVMALWLREWNLMRFTTVCMSCKNYNLDLTVLEIDPSFVSKFLNMLLSCVYRWLSRCCVHIIWWENELAVFSQQEKLKWLFSSSRTLVCIFQGCLCLFINLSLKLYIFKVFNFMCVLWSNLQCFKSSWKQVLELLPQWIVWVDNMCGYHIFIKQVKWY